MALLALRRGFKSFRLPSVRLVTVRRTCEPAKRFWWGSGAEHTHVCLLTVDPHDQVSQRVDVDSDLGGVANISTVLSRLNSLGAPKPWNGARKATAA